MASGPVSRTDRPNTWLLRPALRRDRSLDNPEPSTHGPKRTPILYAGTVPLTVPHAYDILSAISRCHRGGAIPMAKTVFYARVSTRDQNPSLQTDAAKQLGVKSENIFVEKAERQPQ